MRFHVPKQAKENGMLEPCIAHPIHIDVGDVDQPGHVFRTTVLVELVVRVTHGDAPAVEPEPLDVAALQDDRHPADRLTEREREVLAMVADGLSNQQIAAQLILAESTIKSYIRTVIAKLGVATRVEAAVHPFAQSLRQLNRAA
jgi:DNA-binding NarL/FixJ family response regulator